MLMNIRCQYQLDLDYLCCAKWIHMIAPIYAVRKSTFYCYIVVCTMLTMFGRFLLTQAHVKMCAGLLTQLLSSVRSTIHFIAFFFLFFFICALWRSTLCLPPDGATKLLEP